MSYTEVQHEADETVSMAWRWVRQDETVSVQVAARDWLDVDHETHGMTSDGDLWRGGLMCACGKRVEADILDRDLTVSELDGVDLNDGDAIDAVARPVAVELAARMDRDLYQAHRELAARELREAVSEILTNPGIDRGYIETGDGLIGVHIDDAGDLVSTYAPGNHEDTYDAADLADITPADLDLTPAEREAIETWTRTALDY